MTRAPLCTPAWLRAAPLIVAPLVEPGLLGIWEVGRLEPEHRTAAERAIANQVAFHVERIPLRCLSGMGGSAARRLGD